MGFEMVTVVSVVGAILLGIVFYDLWVYGSLRHEQKYRLEDPAVREALQEISIRADIQLPACLLLHGFGGSPYDMKPLAEALAAKHRTVLVPCLAGHARRSVSYMRESSQEEWFESAQQAFKRLREDHEEVDVVGFSLGGLLGLELAQQCDVRRVVLINPYTDVTYRWIYVLPVRFWQRLVGALIPYVRKPRSGQINDLAGRKHYEPSYMHLPVRSYAELNELSERIWNTTRPLGKPLLFIYSTGDIVSSPSKMERYSRQLCVGPNDRVIRFRRSNHVLLYDYDHEEVISAAMGFLSSEYPRKNMP